MVKGVARAPSTVSRAEAFQDLQAHGYGTATHNDRLDCFDWTSAQKRDDFARAVSSNGFLWKGEPVTLNSPVHAEERGMTPDATHPPTPGSKSAVIWQLHGSRAAPAT